MYEYEIYPRGEEVSKIRPDREKSKLGCVGKRTRNTCLSEKNLLSEERLRGEFAVLKKCLPSFVTIQFPNGFLDMRRFDVVISLVGEIINNDYYGGRNYKFEFRIPEEYPISPPLVKCVTPVFHPNIGDEGGVGLRMLRAAEGIYSCYGWGPTDTIEGVIFRLYRFLFHPCNEDTFVVNQDAAYLYRRNPAEFKSLVRRVAAATICNAKKDLNLPARNNYYLDSESFCLPTSSSHSADYCH